MSTPSSALLTPQPWGCRTRGSHRLSVGALSIFCKVERPLPVRAPQAQGAASLEQWGMVVARGRDVSQGWWAELLLEALVGWGALFQHLWLPARSFPSLTPGRIAFFSAKSPSVPVLQGHLSLPTQDSLPISRSIITSANGLFSYSVTITGLRVLGSGPLGGHRLGCCRSVIKEEEEVAGGERAGSMYQHLKHAWCLVGAPVNTGRNTCLYLLLRYLNFSLHLNPVVLRGGFGRQKGGMSLVGQKPRAFQSHQHFVFSIQGLLTWHGRARSRGE